MDIKASIKSQYRASLAMLEQAVADCPEALWDDRAYSNPFWRLAFHALFYTHLYLQPSEADFVPWEKQRSEMRLLQDPPEEGDKPNSKSEILEFSAFSREQVERQVSELDLDAESGFYWLPFDKLELQFYNIRHLMQHTGELCERLGATGAVEVDWVGRG